MFIDTHSHLFLPPLSQHIDLAIDNLVHHNFSHSIQIGTSIESSYTCIELSKRYSILRATVGIHPCEAQDIWIEKIPEKIKELENMIQENQNYIVWFWEIWFDNYHLSDDEEIAKKQQWNQLQWFRAQAELAKKYNLPVVIHTRNASHVTLWELLSSGLEKFVVHCFSENSSFAYKIFDISENSMIGFTGILTYKNATEVQEVAKNSPLNRILIETDAPYLLPECMKRKAQYCEPYHTKFVYEYICQLRSEDKIHIEDTIWKSSLNFFNLT